MAHSFSVSVFSCSLPLLTRHSILPVDDYQHFASSRKLNTVVRWFHRCFSKVIPRQSTENKSNQTDLAHEETSIKVDVSITAKIEIASVASSTAAIIMVAFVNQRKKQNSLSILPRLERQRCLTEKECYFDVGVMLWSSWERVLLDEWIVAWVLDNRLNNTSVPTTNFSHCSNIFEKRFSDEKTDLISTDQSINHLVPVLSSLWKTASQFFPLVIPWNFAEEENTLEKIALLLLLFGLPYSLNFFHLKKTAFLGIVS